MGISEDDLLLTYDHRPDGSVWLTVAIACHLPPLSHDGVEVLEEAAGISEADLGVALACVAGERGRRFWDLLPCLDEAFSTPGRKRLPLRDRLSQALSRDD